MGLKFSDLKTEREQEIYVDAFWDGMAAGMIVQKQITAREEPDNDPTSAVQPTPDP